MSTFSTLRDHCYNGYTPPPPRVALMAWVFEPGNHSDYYAEIVDTDGDSRIAYLDIPGHMYHHPVPFSALQSVALCQGLETIQAFGRPPAASIPDWVEYAEVVA